MVSGRFGLVFLFALGLAGTGFADSTQDRLDRMERELNQLQRQVYRSEVSTAPTPSGSEAGGGNQALDLQIRMDQLEAQMRTLTGQLEEVQYNIGQLASRLDKMQADNEQRFQALENTAAATPAPVAPTPGQKGKPAPSAPPARPGHGAGDMDQAPSTAGVLAAPGEHPPAEVPAPQTAAASGGLPSGSVQEQYNYAFGLLRQGEYQEAEAAFKAFLQKHPADPLAANAQYWLGETYFVRGDYAAASTAFAEGYRKFPQGAKAADDLMKLGISLADQGRKQDACFAFARLERDFPSAGTSMKERLASEKKHAGC
jgi:tol-pal system protein YbgF